LKVFIDNNVLVAAYMAQGLCREVLAYCDRRFDMVVTEAILHEFEAVLRKKFKVPAHRIKAWLEEIRTHYLLVPEPKKVLSRCRDASDDAHLQAALDADCDLLISGDKDLLVLKKVEGLPILSPRQFMEVFGIENEES